MRTPTSQLTAAQLRLLPRVTRWRSKKRGWVCLNYFVRSEFRDDVFFQENIARLQRIAHHVALRCRRQNIRHPFLDACDIEQEVLIHFFLRAARLRLATGDGLAYRMAWDGALKALGFYGRASKKSGGRRDEQGRYATNASRFHVSLDTPLVRILAAPTAEPKMSDWATAMLGFCRQSLTAAEYEILESYIAGERIRLTEHVRHKLHHIFHTEERCEECSGSIPLPSMPNPSKGMLWPTK